ncbi:hypothetical protein [Salipaludibacillus aurantiacus]|uniref:hypothetical protein n=1 Tax=Salipaludibacillus aurantiacus TaxID=1601833 RepID=UPI0015A528CE|nr:hypothetical protein [Salipaludibacillus aurantiacus]
MKSELLPLNTILHAMLPIQSEFRNTINAVSLNGFDLSDYNKPATTIGERINCHS